MYISALSNMSSVEQELLISTPTFAPNCRNEYFTPDALFIACKYGLSFDKLPEEAKKMVLEYTKEYNKRCPKPGEKQKFPSPMFSSDAIV
ncbi:MAG: hypothetical protein EB830_04330 [Nitrosopumilus sp. H13]|nr:MAG: hypothetical protein EB830_04330 [Nitrosopumilus sp. H13]